MATFTVTTLADSGAGSLREAIALANNQGAADTITFDKSLAGGTIALSSVLQITGGLTIVGDIDNDNVADITLDGKDLIITADDGSVLVLKGVDLDDLSKDCFQF